MLKIIIAKFLKIKKKNLVSEILKWKLNFHKYYNILNSNL